MYQPIPNYSKYNRPDLYYIFVGTWLLCSKHQMLAEAGKPMKLFEVLSYISFHHAIIPVQPSDINMMSNSIFLVPNTLNLQSKIKIRYSNIGNNIMTSPVQKYCTPLTI